MSVKTDVINLQINVNSNQAQNQLNELRKKSDSIRTSMEGLKKSTQEYKDKALELKQVNTQMDELKRTIGVTALSQRELEREITKLQRLKGHAVPFTQEYKDFAAQLKVVEGRLYEVKNNVSGFSKVFSKIKDEVKQFGAVAVAYLGFQFVSEQFTNIIRGAGKTSDQLADLRRVSGLTAEGVTGLNKSLTNLDTRTSAGSLRDISIIAGKLGVEGADGILKFTAATDKLVVALGDELGNADQITTSLGKILNVFDGGVNGDNISKLGNAIVQLANDGVASGGFIVDFTTRLAGLSNVAGITLDASVGLAAGLEELGLRSESSTTAVIKILGDIATDTEKFAKVAGKSVEEFSKTLAEKPIEALIQVSEGFTKNKAGFAEISSSFKEAGADGARVVSVLGTIGGKADFLREKITDAGVALQNTNAINDAFTLKNESLGASIDKLGKDFNRLIASSNVSNFLKGFIDGATSFVNVLKGIPKFIDENSTALKFLAAGIALMNIGYIKSAALIALDTYARIANAVATRASAIATNVASSSQAYYITVTSLAAGRISAATAAQRLWNIAISAGTGPIGLIIGLVGALYVAYKTLKIDTDAASAATRVHSEIQKRAADGYGDELQKIRELTNVLKDNSISRETQKAALAELIALNPKYLSGLTAENIATAEGTKILNDYVAALRKKAEQQAATELQAEKIKQDIKLLQKQKEIETAIANGSATYVNLSDRLIGASGEKFSLARIKKEREAIAQELKVTDDIIKEKYKVIGATVATGGTDGKTGNTSNAVTGRTIEMIKAQIKSLDEAFEKIDVTNKKALTANKNLRADLQRELDALEGKKSPGARKEERQVDQLKKEAQEFAKELQRLRREAENNNLEDKDREIQIAQDKFNDLTARAKKYWAATTADGKKAAADIEAIRTRQIEAIMKKYFEADAAKEYEGSLAASEKFFDEQRREQALSYSRGAIDKQSYENSLTDIELREADNRVVIAQDYADTVKKAAADITGFEAKQSDLRIKNAINEGERKKAATEAETIAGLRLKVITSPKGSDRELEAKKALLKKQFELDTEYLDKKSNVYLEKQAQLNKDLEDLALAKFQADVDKILKLVDYFSQAMQSITTILANRENKELQRDKKANDTRRSAYKSQLDGKLISQERYDKKIAELQKQEETKEKEIRLKQAKREKALAVFNAIINTAAGIAKAIPNLALMALAGIVGGLQIAAIKSAPLPEMGTGGLLRNGPKHRDSQRGLHVVNPLTGRTEMLLEREEAVIAARAMNSNRRMTVSGTPRQIASAVNSTHGGVSFATGAQVKWHTAALPRFKPQFVQMMATGGIIGGSSNSAANAANNAGADYSMAIVEEIRQMREDMSNWQTNLGATISFQELRQKQDLYDRAKATGRVDK